MPGRPDHAARADPVPAARPGRRRRRAGAAAGRPGARRPARLAVPAAAGGRLGDRPPDAGPRGGDWPAAQRSPLGRPAARRHRRPDGAANCRTPPTSRRPFCGGSGRCWKPNCSPSWLWIRNAARVPGCPGIATSGYRADVCAARSGQPKLPASTVMSQLNEARKPRADDAAHVPTAVARRPPAVTLTRSRSTGTPAGPPDRADGSTTGDEQRSPDRGHRAQRSADAGRRGPADPGGRDLLPRGHARRAGSAADERSGRPDRHPAA